MDWIVEAFGTAALTALAAALINLYFSSKLKHELDVKLEGIKPITAEETLRRQNLLNAKRDAFFEAINALSAYLEAVPWSGPDIPEDRPVLHIRPSEAQVNTAVAKLAIFADNPKIIDAYLHCFVGASAPQVGELINLMRFDLGYGNLKTDPSSYKIYFKREPNLS